MATNDLGEGTNASIAIARSSRFINRLTVEYWTPTQGGYSPPPSVRSPMRGRACSARAQHDNRSRAVTANRKHVRLVLIEGTGELLEIRG